MEQGEFNNLFDTSAYPKDHPLYSIVNKKVLGKMKDECAGRPIAEFTGLRSKMYSILEAGGMNTKKAKGVKRYVVEKNIRHDQYMESLRESKTFTHGMNTIRSKGHKIYTQRMNKISLSPLDTKRWIAANGIDTLAYGHKDISPKIPRVWSARSPPIGHIDSGSRQRPPNMVDPSLDDFDFPDDVDL